MKRCTVHFYSRSVSLPASVQEDRIILDQPFDWYNLEAQCAAVEQDGRWGVMCINAQTWDPWKEISEARLVIPFLYEEIETLFDSDGIIAAKREGRWGAVDFNGKEIVPFIYECTRSFNGRFIPVKKDGLWGVVDRNGQEVLPLAYDLIFLNICISSFPLWPTSPIDASYAIRDGRVTLFDKELQPVWTDLTAAPLNYGNYLLLRHGRKFGVAAQDGRPITNLTMLKREAVFLLRKLCGTR